MKNKAEQLEEDEHDLEILKAVAQAWHGRSDNSRATNEFDARRLHFKHKPSRFKLEAMSKALTKRPDWDFSQSLWDSYEIVAVSRRLEAGLVLDHNFSDSDYRKRKKESNNSLRNLFSRKSSRKFNEAEIPQKEGT